LKTIWKFPLEIVDQQEVEMPAEAGGIHVEMQNNQLCLWSMVDPEAPKVSVKIRVVGTGHPIPDADKLTHLGSCLMAGGALVWHVFKKD